MGKSILVIDTPVNCKSCPFCKGLNACKIMKFLSGDKITTIYTVDKQIFDGTKPNWCPLIDLPKKMAETSRYGGNVYFAEGYNACIDKILKGAGRNE